MSARDSLIFSVTQAISYSFGFHTKLSILVSSKRLDEESWGRQCSFMVVVSQGRNRRTIG